MGRPYFMQVFCAGMTSTQRSEGANRMLKRYIQKAAPMHLFVSKFNKLLYDRMDQEAREQHATKLVSRKRRVGVPIERHAEKIYTRAMYEKFYDELFKAGKYAIKEATENGMFKLLDTEAEAKGYERTVQVRLSEDKAICECGLYEHMGMPCCHTLKVLMYLDRREIPKETS